MTNQTKTNKIMGRCDNYPDWTWDGDPRAPWNEPPSLEEQFGDQANDYIADEIKDRADEFTEWLDEQGYTPDKTLVDENTYDRIVDLLAEDDKVSDDYYEYRKDDVLEQLAADAEYQYNNQDDDRRDYDLDR